MDDGHEHNFVALPLHHSYVSVIDVPDRYDWDTYSTYSHFNLSHLEVPVLAQYCSHFWECDGRLSNNSPDISFLVQHDTPFSSGAFLSFRYSFQSPLHRTRLPSRSSKRSRVIISATYPLVPHPSHPLRRPHPQNYPTFRDYGTFLNDQNTRSIASSRSCRMVSPLQCALPMT
ncbi:hypothetical protein BJV78DRAFT_670450 [Lactifluus subvellereus]|nr:hypothetical protein BJV78DRAFT_670450 [Lactifluus subvellereus]